MGGTKLGFGGPVGVQDGLDIVLVRFFFRLAVRVRFFGPLGVVLGHFWPRFRPSWGLLGSFLGTPDGLSELSNPINLYSHQLIDSSTLQPMTCQHFATRPGGLRAARSAARSEVEGERRVRL